MTKLSFQKQSMMRRVLLALLPILLFAVYLYGLRVLWLALVVFPIGVGLEYLFELKRKKKVSEAVLVTCLLYLLCLPPAVPLWVAAVGIAFAVVVGKEIYGGFGRNPFNPAITGRLFIYLTFPGSLTSGWLSAGNFGLDATTAATPLKLLGQGGEVDSLQLLLGLRAGSLGESAIILILLAGIYLVVTKTASWRIMLSTLGSFALLSFCLDFFGVPGALPVLPGLLSGSLLFVTVFMATDPVSAPKQPGAQWLYGLLIGSCTGLIRTCGAFPEGTSFGVLIANTFGSLFDEFFKKRKAA